MNRAALAFERPADRQATRPPEERGVARDDVRLMVTTPAGHQHARFGDLPAFLDPGTLLVVNRSATLPASLPAEGAIGRFRLNLATRYGAGVWLAEPRRGPADPGPLPLRPGDDIRAAGLAGRVIAPYPALPRLLFVRFEGDVHRAMARAGSPIRYGYIEPPIPPLDAYQTMFADTPGSAEMPSAARPFTPRVVAALRASGVQLASVVLHTGVSSLEVETDNIDDHPLQPEPFVVPRETAAAVNAARLEGRAVIAVGTTVVRAIESARAAGHGQGTSGQPELRATAGFTRRFIRPGHGARIVDGLLTGFHDPHASHLALLFALAHPDLVHHAYAEAVRREYLWHEFGDSHLIVG